ncbi:hypothetical protein K2173_022356 [Erythroxylum novogranatense]|uniref:DELLA RGL1-like protein n=1 Tax=Erythroxylum novogranatense TaxID=1862640 RepID=A0AAV8THD6_9ROSI|nr:hypothetical protein K2173_022356 [Erythroxylum novogranatense]
MENTGFSYEEFDSGVDKRKGEKQKRCSSYNECCGESAGFGVLCPDGSLYQDVPCKQSMVFSKHHHQQQEQAIFEYQVLDEGRFNMVLPQIERYRKDIYGGVEPEKDKRDSDSLASLELLKSHGKGFNRLNRKRILELSNDTACKKQAFQELSTEEIIRIAGTRFIQSSTQVSDDTASELNNPFNLSFSNLSDEDEKNVEIAELLLASSEKVGNQQFESASRLLKECQRLASKTGNSVQRIVHYFSEALQERIDRATGEFEQAGYEKRKTVNIDEVIMAPTPDIMASYRKVPFSQLSQFAGIQAIVENIAEAKRIHVIDLGIRCGVQWTLLMQALISRSEQPVELLKISAVGTTMKQVMEDTGDRLIAFAQSIGLPFSFKLIMVSDMLELKHDLFDLDPDETIAIFGEYILRSLLPLPDRLHYIMQEIRKLNPSIMVVTEVDANINSPVFVNRFIEALFYFSAYFDCLDACLKDDPNRLIIESVHLGEGIRNIVATEGEERTIRNVKIDIWRLFFSRFGMEELEFSSTSLYQANMIAEKFNCGSSCSAEMNGKALLFCWKGTPIHCLSAWKFFRDEERGDKI